MEKLFDKSPYIHRKKLFGTDTTITNDLSAFAITPRLQPGRRLTGTDYQHFTANLGNIWETL